MAGWNSERRVLAQERELAEADTGADDICLLISKSLFPATERGASVAVTTGSHTSPCMFP